MEDSQITELVNNVHTRVSDLESRMGQTVSELHDRLTNLEQNLTAPGTPETISSEIEKIKGILFHRLGVKS